MIYHLAPNAYEVITAADPFGGQQFPSADYTDNLLLLPVAAEIKNQF